MPNWIRDSGGRLVKRETPHNKELELSLNIMEATLEDQHSHHGHQDNPNEALHGKKGIRNASEILEVLR